MMLRLRGTRIGLSRRKGKSLASLGRLNNMPTKMKLVLLCNRCVSGFHGVVAVYLFCNSGNAYVIFNYNCC
jgi:hypothetical protein